MTETKAEYKTGLAVAEPPETGMARIKNYMLSPEVKDRFEQMMGSGAIYYLNQVLILVANSPALQSCEPKSILIAAMRAASLKLNVDVSSGQAWIIPYKGKATFQLGYRGVYELAQRTNLYRFINVIDIYEGEELIEDRMTGMHTIGGKRASDKVIARMLYFQLTNGFEKTYAMTVEEIAEHAAKYSVSYNYKDSPWNNPTERPKMEKKTVLVNGLRKWGRFNPGDAETLDAIESEQGWISNGEVLPDEAETTPPPEPPKMTQEERMSALGFGGPKKEETHDTPLMSFQSAAECKTSRNEAYGTLPDDRLQYMLNSLTSKLAGEQAPEEREDREYKRDAILTLMYYRQHPEQIKEQK